MREDLHRSLVIDTLEMGWFQRRPRKGELIFHSDRGSRYASEDFRQVLDRHGIRAWMRRILQGAGQRGFGMSASFPNRNTALQQ
jgi:transposase InsO family protein